MLQDGITALTFSLATSQTKSVNMCHIQHLADTAVHRAHSQRKTRLCVSHTATLGCYNQTAVDANVVTASWTTIKLLAMTVPITE